jgi:hypothetical protein
MSDSSDNAELFADDDDINHEEMERLNANDPPPDYTNGEEFKKFIKDQKIQLD